MSTGVEILPIFLAYAAYHTIRKAMRNQGKVTIPEWNDGEEVHQDNTIASELACADSYPEDLTMDMDEETTTNTVIINTPMTDRYMLVRALEDCDYSVDYSGKTVRASRGNVSVIFSQNAANNSFTMKFAGLDSSEASEASTEIFDIYGRLGQQTVYENIMASASENGLSLESEIVHDDNTIEMVFVVEE